MINNQPTKVMTCILVWTLLLPTLIFGQQAGKAADRAVTRVMKLESFEGCSTKTDEQLARFGTLNGDLGQFD